MTIFAPQRFVSLRRTGALGLAFACATRGFFGVAAEMSSHKLSKHGTTLTLEPKSRSPDALVVLSHGLGDSAQGWIDTVSDGIAPRLPYARFVLPTAPNQPVTVNMGHVMPSWYDIESLGHARSRHKEKAAGIEKSQATIESIIAQAMQDGIKEDRIVLAGFSQGGALSLFTGLNHPSRLGGIVVMSAYMPVPDKVQPPVPIASSGRDGDSSSSAASASSNAADVSASGAAVAAATDFAAMSVSQLKQYLKSRGADTSGLLEKSEFVALAASLPAAPSGAAGAGGPGPGSAAAPSLQTPILFCHGDEDEVVPIELGRDAEKRCRELGSREVEFRVIPGMPHGADPGEVSYVTSWIAKRVPRLQ